MVWSGLRVIDFYYFSGTGNTFMVVSEMKRVFERYGFKVNLFRIEKADPCRIKLTHMIGLGFPVALQGTYPFVWRFIHSLPRANGTPIFMVDTLSLFSGGVVGSIRRILKAKGYHTVGAGEIRMPMIFPTSQPAEKNAWIIHRGLEEARIYAEKIINGDAEWRGTPILSDFIAALSQCESAWRILRKLYPLRFDRSRCSRCGLCIELCPTNNIRMDKYPVLGDKCYLCMRCIAFCPERAISIPKMKRQANSKIEPAEILNVRA